MRATDALYATTAQFKILRAPTASNDTTYGAGTNGQVLRTNGTSVYWGSFAASDVPTISITDKTSGTLTIARGGTSATTAAEAKYNLGLGASTAQNFSVANTNEKNQHWVIRAVVIDPASAGKAFVGKNTGLILKDNGISFYNFSDASNIFNFQTDLTQIYFNTTDINKTVTFNAKILFKDNNSNEVGNSTTPVYVTAAGKVTAGTALKALAYKDNLTKSDVGLGNVTNDAQIAKSVLSGAYDILYSSSANTPARLAANTTTTRKFLRMTGTGSAGAAPAWDTVTKTDIGLSNVENTALSTWTGTTNITTLGTISTVGKITTTKPINQMLTGSGTAAVTTSPYKPARWTFNAGITPANGDIITIKIPIVGHSYGVFLSVNNGTSYHPVIMMGTTRITTHFSVNMPLTLVFDSSASAAGIYPLEGGTATTTVTGGAWRVINFYDTNTVPTAHCTTAGATAAKSASCSNFVLRTNGYIHVLCSAANTVQGAITLNINGTGAKPIYINGSASSASNYTLPAGTYLVKYNGTNYYFRTDDYITTGNIYGNATNVSGTVAIANGGTGATTRINAVNKLLALGTDFVASTDVDTVDASWKGAVAGQLSVAYFSNTGRIIDQPSQYGNVLNIVNTTSGSIVDQLWFTHQSSGYTDTSIYHRHGSGSGWWSNSWVKMLDELNYAKVCHNITARTDGTNVALHFNVFEGLTGPAAFYFMVANSSDTSTLGPGYFAFRQYSYNPGSKKRLETYETYRFPPATANLASTPSSYMILARNKNVFTGSADPTSPSSGAIWLKPVS